ncbi:MAG: arsenate reductase (glutaredoxin) [Chromatiales bacterium]|nr:MAG: arsenate reductase (glutaredoxin) [Chromatiales bacterium]
MSLKIYHNPRCSKSRNTLEIIRNAGLEPKIVRYLDEAPSAAEILDLAGKLGGSVADLLRRGESEFKNAPDLPDLDDDAALAAWVAAHPKVLERPIVVDTASGKAVMGRPPENVHQLLS